LDPLFLAIFLYFVALALAAIDIFVPSGGVLILLGIVAAVASIFCAFQVGVTAGLIMATVVAGSIPVFFVLAIKIWPRTPLGKRILLKPPRTGRPIFERSLDRYIGSVVVNRWPLMPMGSLQIGHQSFNAVSADGTVIDPGQRVKVVAVHESMLVITPTQDPLTPSPGKRSERELSETRQLHESEEALLSKPAEELGLDQLEDLPLDRDDL
jgi:membrane-bound ClpP family serine protease